MLWPCVNQILTPGRGRQQIPCKLAETGQNEAGCQRIHKLILRPKGWKGLGFLDRPVKEMTRRFVAVAAPAPSRRGECCYLPPGFWPDFSQKGNQGVSK